MWSSTQPQSTLLALARYIIFNETAVPPILNEAQMQIFIICLISFYIIMSYISAKTAPSQLSHKLCAHCGCMRFPLCLVALHNNKKMMHVVKNSRLS